MRTFAVLSCLAVCAMSQAIVIDTFDIAYEKTLSTGSWVDFQTDPSLLTGERDVETRVTREFGSSSGTVSIGNGRMAITNGANGRIFALLEYDGIGDEGGNTGAGKRLIHGTPPQSPFPSGTRAVRFHVERATSLVTLEIHLYKNGVRLFNTFRNPGPGTNFITDVNLSPTAFAQCDSLVVITSPSASNSELIITKTELVPEPGTTAVLLAGVGLLGIGKRKSRA